MKQNMTNCELCGCIAELKHKEFPGYQEPDTFKIYHCPNCNTAFSLPRVETLGIYESIYKNGNKVPGYDRYWNYAEAVKETINPLDFLAQEEDTYWAVKEALSFSENDKKTTKILEIGSGLGYLTYSLIKANYDAIGLDISQAAVSKANETYGNHFICADLFEYAELNAEAFDIVILTEVIEHVDVPLNFIKSIVKLLKPNGKAIITTPNKSFYDKNVIWASDLPPVHCWWLSEESMKYIANQINLKISFIDFSNYYKHNPQQVDMKMLKNNKLKQPMLNRKGELIIRDIIIQKPSKSHFRLIISQLPFARKFYVILRELFNGNIAICKAKGTVLCVILQK